MVCSLSYGVLLGVSFGNRICHICIGICSLAWLAIAVGYNYFTRSNVRNVNNTDF